MEPQSSSSHKTYKYHLNPTPAQEHALEAVLSRCHTLYNVALEQRKTWWERGQGRGATYYQQKAELPDLKAACPDYAAVNAQVLQDVILRVERAFQAFFRRLKQGDKQGAGGKNQGIPASRDGGATPVSPIRSMEAALSWMAGYSASRRLVVSLFGCIGPWQAHPRPSPSVGKPMAGTPVSRVRTCPLSRCRQRARKPASTWA